MKKRFWKKIAKNRGLSYGKLLWLSPDVLVAHPDNPRLYVREDVVSTIAEKLSTLGLFSPQYALTVRPMPDGTYQVISGHHRLAAALRSGIRFVPCWSRLMDDEEAYAELVLANSQSELLPIEVAVHVYRYVDRAKGGRGEEGGLSDYARAHKMSKQRVSELCRAGEVYATVHPSGHPDTFRKKIQHLLVIYNECPREDWAGLVQMIQNKPAMTVADIESEVVKIRKQVFFDKNEDALATPAETNDVLPADSVPVTSIGDPDDEDPSHSLSAFASLAGSLYQMKLQILTLFNDLKTAELSDDDSERFDETASRILADCQEVADVIHASYCGTSVAVSLN